MAKPKVTEMLPANVRPVHAGVYEISMGHGKFDRYANWSGKVWGMTASTVNEAASNPNRGWDCYTDRFNGWRGLAEQPKEQKK